MTFLEKFKLEKSAIWNGLPEELRSEYHIGCPFSYNFEPQQPCAVEGHPYITCKDCWNREIPAEKIEIKEEKKMKLSIREAIADRVIEFVSTEEIEEAVVEKISSYDFSEVVNDVIDEMMDDIDDEIKEAAHDAVQDAVSQVISDLF